MKILFDVTVQVFKGLHIYLSLVIFNYLMFSSFNRLVNLPGWAESLLKEE